MQIKIKIESDTTGQHFLTLSDERMDNDNYVELSVDESGLVYDVEIEELLRALTAFRKEMKGLETSNSKCDVCELRPVLSGVRKKE